MGVQLYPTVEFGEAVRDAAMTLFPPSGNPPPWLVTDEAEIAAYWNYRSWNDLNEPAGMDVGFFEMPFAFGACEGH